MNPITINSITQLLKVLAGFLINIALPGSLISYVILRSKLHWVYRIGASIIIGWTIDVALGGLWILAFGKLSAWVIPVIPLSASLIIWVIYKVRKREPLTINPEVLFTFKNLNYLFLFAVLLVGFAGGIWLTRNNNPPEQYFTEFYMLDQNDKLPVRLQVDGNNHVILTIGVISHEEISTGYTILVKHGPVVLDTIGPFFLDPGQKFQTPFTYHIQGKNSFTQSDPLIFELDKDNQSYRILTIY